MVRRRRAVHFEATTLRGFQAPRRRVLDLSKMIDSDAGIRAFEPLTSGMSVQLSVGDPQLPLALPELERCLSPTEAYFNPPFTTGSDMLSLQLPMKMDDGDHDGISTAASSTYDGSPRISCQKGCRIASEDHDQSTCTLADVGQKAKMCRESTLSTLELFNHNELEKREIEQEHSRKKIFVQFEALGRAQTSPRATHVPIEQVWCLATSQAGSRMVQDALEDADNSEGIAIASELRGHVWEAVNCQHANHVLQKCIKKLPPSACQFIIEELRRDPGSAKYLAKHRFGCRVFQRLLEHCSPDQLQGLVDDALGRTSGAVAALCRHPFGNYVAQLILEHGSCDQRCRVVAALADEMPRIAAARHASAVLSKALCHSSSQDRASLARAMLKEPARLARMAKERFGHTAVEQLMRDAGGEEQAVRYVLALHVADLNDSRYGRSIAKELGARACD